MSSGKVKCTCGWSWNKSDSSKKDMYICHECGRDNSNNMQNGGWLDSYADGGTMQEHQENYNDSQASAPEGMVGDGFSNVGRNYSPAWGGQFKEGGLIPIAQNGKATSADSLAVYNDVMRTKNYYETHNTKYFNKPKTSPGWWADKKRMDRIKRDHLEHPDVTAANKQKIKQNKNPNQYLLADMITGAIDPNAPLFRYDTRITPQGTINYDPKFYLVPAIKKLDPNFDKLSDSEQGAIINMLSGYNSLTTPKEILMYRKWKGKHPHDLKKMQALNKLDIEVSNHTPGYVTTLPYYDPLAVKPYSLRTPQEKIEWQKKYGSTKTKTKDTDKDKPINTPVKNTPVVEKEQLTSLQPMSRGLENTNIQIDNSDINIPIHTRVPQSYDVTSQRQTMNGPNDYYDYNEQGVNIEQAIKAKQAADVYNQSILEKYGNNKNPKAQERLKKLKQDIELTPHYQMGGSIPGAVGFSYARTQGAAPSNGPGAKKTMASAQTGVKLDMYGAPITAIEVNDPSVDRTYYDDRTNRMMLGNDFTGWIKDENLQDEVKTHENYHAKQFNSGRYNYDIAHNTDQKQWAEMQKKPQMMSTSNVWGNYYNRKGKELEKDLQTINENYPELGFLPDELLVDKIIDNEQYSNPNSMEGEAMYYENTGKDFYKLQNGGWLDSYDVAQEGEKLPSVRSLINDTMNRKIQSKGKEVNTVQKDNTKTSTPKEIKKLSGIQKNRLAQQQSEEQAAKDYVQANMEEAYKSPLMSPGYFTPEGMAIGAIQGAVKMPGHIAEGDGWGVAGDVAMMLPFAKPAAKTLGRALGTEEGLLNNLSKSRSVNELKGSLVGIPPERALPRLSPEELKIYRQVQDIGRMRATGKPISQQYKYALEQGIPEEHLQQIFNKSKSELETIIPNAQEEEAFRLANPFRERISLQRPPRRTSTSDQMIDVMNSSPEQLSDFASQVGMTEDELVNFARSSMPQQTRSDVIRHTLSDYDIDRFTNQLNPIQEEFILNTGSTRGRTLIPGQRPGMTLGESFNAKNADVQRDIYNAAQSTKNKIIASSQNYPYYEGPVLENVPSLSLSASGSLKNVSNKVAGQSSSNIGSGDIFTGSLNTSHSSYLPQLKQVFKYGEGAPQFLGYKPMNHMGFLSDYRYPSKDIAKYLNTEIDTQISRGVIPKDIQRPYVKGEKVLLPHYGIKQFKEGGIIKDDRGQWDHPGEITEINSNDITMEGVPYDVLGISDTGDTKLMKPGKKYKFKGKKVTEYPMAKNGLRQEQKGLVNLDQLTNFTNYNTKQPGGWLDTL